MLEIKEIDESLDVRLLIPFEGEMWEIWANRLGIPYGIDTKLFREGLDFIKDAVWLDWYNVLQEPGNSRLLLPDKSKSFAKRFNRTHDLCIAIRVYDEVLMEPRKSCYSSEEIEEMLRRGKLPRPDLVFIDAERSGFDYFFRQQGFEPSRKGDHYYPYAYRVPWSALVGLASEGHLPLF